MRKTHLLLASSLVAASCGGAVAQGTWDIGKSCTMTSGQLQVGQFRRNTEAAMGYLQVNQKTELSGPLPDVSVKIDAKEISGVTGTATNQFVRVVFNEGWTDFVQRLGRGQEIVISSGDAAFTASLTGTGKVLKNFQMCISQK